MADWPARLQASWDWLTGSNRRGVLALVVLCLAVYLPGVLRLPAVDRTEIVFAETTRDMAARGAWLDPRYGDTVHAFRPIGTFWAQGLAAIVAGPAHARDISVYRLPGMIAVTLSVLALFGFATPVVGRAPALLAAGLFAVAPLTVLLGHLAIADGLALLPATVAMLTLWRLYIADDALSDPTARLAALFWCAVGAGMLVNALHTPILIAATVITLAIFDRHQGSAFGWLKRLRPLIGLPIALFIAAPWLYVRTLQDGVPFATLAWPEFLAALGGAQDMKLRAFPGTFVLAALLGFLPGTALLGPAIARAWGNRGDRPARFLLAWMIGYIVYLEAISSKPGTYMVQTMFPAFALAVASFVAVRDRKPADSTTDSGANTSTLGKRLNLIPPAPLAAALPVVIFGTLWSFARVVPSLIEVAAVAAVAALFAYSASAGRAAQYWRWGQSGIAALALFAVTLLAMIVPSLDRLWPARELKRLVTAACEPAAAIAVAGFREPTAAFVLDAPRDRQSLDALFAPGTSVRIVESRWLERYLVANAVRGHGQDIGTALGCVTGYNVMRGCPLSFTVLRPKDGAGSCTPVPAYACRMAEQLNPRPPSKGCD